MASGLTPSVSGSSAESNETSDSELRELIVNLGTEALRRTFRRLRPHDLQVVLNAYKHTLSMLKGSIINEKQWDKLYPPNKPDIDGFDISLMCILLRNICGLKPPKSPVWKNEPLTSDLSVEADIVRIRSFRNEESHVPNTTVSVEDFQNSWENVRLTLLGLGINQSEIDSLRPESILDKKLVCFDFAPEIELHYEKFKQDTREWVFEQVFAWFDNESSENRAFVISALAGMGKSVIAAVICKRLAEHIGACHFVQYNNSRYSNPNSLLQSIARQLCKVIPAYKKALILKLYGNLGQSLNSMNVEGLFSLLFKEPFSSIPGNGKSMLIVLDAVDESEHKGRRDLANVIANHFHKLPSNIRFLITTRPEQTLIEKFKQLNPLYIKNNDERNLDDIKLVLQKSECVDDLIDILADKSDGLMLYAFLLSEIWKDEPCMSDIANFPQGLGEFYEQWFERLKCNLEDRLQISNNTFLSFLSALSVAMEPLPGAFIGSLFGFKKNSVNTKANVNEAVDILSSLLVVKENKSISFFHKSLRDWLVDDSGHDYAVAKHCGHKILFDVCVEELEELKKNEVMYSTQASVALKYALKYFIPHLLNGTENNDGLENFAKNFVADLEVMFASVSVDVDLTLNNISSLMNHELYKHVSKNTSTTVNELFYVVKRFAFLLRDCSQSFLQHVVNECDKELSFKASHLLETRYKNIFCLELVEKKRKRDAVEFRCVSSGKTSAVDVSPKHDYFVCSYGEGGIELFSLDTGVSKWKDDFQVELPVYQDLRPFMLPHCIVFHPCESLILPGRLDVAFTFKGVLMKTELFQCGDRDAKFTNSCFSKDGTKLVTSYGSDLVVWDTFSGEKENHLPCLSQLLSFSFTESGKYLGTTGVDNNFTVYDVIGDYKLIKYITIESSRPVEIVSIFEQNSWCCSVNDQIAIVNHDLQLSGGCEISNILVPNNFYCGELQCFLKDRKQSWFSKVMEILKSKSGLTPLVPVRYIVIRNKSVLVFSSFLNAMFVFSVNDVKNATGRTLNRQYCNTGNAGI